MELNTGIGAFLGLFVILFPILAFILIFGEIVAMRKRQKKILELLRLLAQTAGSTFKSSLTTMILSLPQNGGIVIQSYLKQLHSR